MNYAQKSVHHYIIGKYHIISFLIHLKLEIKADELGFVIVLNAFFILDMLAYKMLQNVFVELLSDGMALESARKDVN